MHAFYLVLLIPIAVWAACSLVVFIGLLFLYYNFGFNEGERVYGYAFIAWTPSSSRNCFGNFLQKYMLVLAIVLGLVMAFLFFARHLFF